MCKNFSLQVDYEHLDNQCPKIPYFTCKSVQLKPWFLTVHRIRLDKLIKTSDSSNSVRFLGERFICRPYLAIKSALK